MFKRILIVCIGNICRSPTAEHLLRQAIKASDIQVSSAGLGALVDHSIESTALAVLKAHDQEPHEHRARQLSTRLLSQADLVLVMERRHIESVTRLAPEARGKTFLLGKWQHDCEIPDPYRKDITAFEHTYRLIEEGVNAWATRLHC
ncbi:low molecular weight protein-tyrosine-phosphatase [Pseudomonas fluorescens]|uniref:protein-tyrosine-phosphatase n=1 Tax=Pseudomonas fluorescens TaxID=294 RepID=A0A5E7VSY6_PSEFL|nr:low molecular weight protein-tyrosine-phosphatase [Pseudomonas fluorescens]VVQ25989.1 Low molecular weight protein-tyrosine-phosphatase Wzb [Pseudomonas fluorescens]